MELNKALQRQIQKFLPESFQQNPELTPFLEAVSKLYTNYEKDKKISEHAFEVSEKEYQIVFNNLKEQDKIQKTSIQRIKNLIQTLNNNVSSSTGEEYDLEEVITFLASIIDETKQLEELLIFAKEQAINSAKDKANFLSVMSHEIRTPLNAIIGCIHLLDSEEVLPSQKEYMHSLQISAENLLNLINDVLDYNKIEEGKIEFAKNEVNLKQLLQNIKLANSFKASENNNQLILNIEESIPDFVIADETRLSQILNNLISNAAKFTLNGEIQINVNFENELVNQNIINFAIKDSGIGINTDNLDQIFERFTQANSNINRKFGGSGLGLTIVKKLLQLQNSDIKVESELGKGSVFYFSLHFEKCDKKSNTVIENNKESKNLNNIKILLVEDNKINTIIAKKMLTNWNSEVDVAENGEIAIEKHQANIYHIILMDLQMPVMDGIKATEIIRQTDTQTPILALTASALFDVKENVKEAGMNGYVSKPFNPDELYTQIKRFVSL